MYTFTKKSYAPCIIFLLFVGTIFTSCLDDEGYVDSFTVGAIHETENIPEIMDADAILLAIRKVALVEQSGFQVVRTAGEARVMFFEENNYPALTHGGNVWINGFLLNNSDFNYGFQVDLTNEEGYVFNGSINWTLEGNDEFPATQKKVEMWPDVGPVVSPRAISYGNDYTLTVDYLENAYATSFQISGIGTLLKEYKQDAHLSHTFSASEILLLGRGPGIVQVNAYYINDTIIDGKHIYFINSEASYEVVDIR